MGRIMGKMPMLRWAGVDTLGHYLSLPLATGVSRVPNATFVVKIVGHLLSEGLID